MKEESKIILDLDGVLFDFIEAIIEFAKNNNLENLLYIKEPKDVVSWGFFDPVLFSWLNDDFWLNIKPLNNANKILDFEPFVYLTSRPVSSYISKMALINNGFPDRPVITVEKPLHKVELMTKGFKDYVLVDDHIETVREIRNSGGNVLLFKSQYHRCCDVSDLTEISNIDTLNFLNKAFNGTSYPIGIPYSITK